MLDLYSRGQKFPRQQHRPALWNPFRVRVQTGYQPGAAFIRIGGFSCPRLIYASLSGSVAALTSSINANTFSAQMLPRSSFVDEPNDVTVPASRTQVLPTGLSQRQTWVCVVPAHAAAVVRPALRARGGARKLTNRFPATRSFIAMWLDACIMNTAKLPRRLKAPSCLISHPVRHV